MAMSLTKSQRRKALQLTGTALGALVLTVATSGSAQANPMQAECSTTGAYGYVYSDWYGSDTRIDFSMTFTDMLADGHHVRARLVTTDVNNVRKNWPWHYNYGGNNTSVDVNSYATNSSGIFNWGIQVARYEGDTYLNSCTNWIV